jgi:hypothetical protein
MPLIQEETNMSKVDRLKKLTEALPKANRLSPSDGA